MPTVRASTARQRFVATLQTNFPGVALALATAIEVAADNPPDSGNSVEDWVAHLVSLLGTNTAAITALQGTVQSIADAGGQSASQVQAAIDATTRLIVSTDAWRGEWAAGTYAAGDLATDNNAPGSIYRRIADGVDGANQNPASNATDWGQALTGLDLLYAERVRDVHTLLNSPPGAAPATLQVLLDKVRVIAGVSTWRALGSHETGATYGRFLVIPGGTELSQYQHRDYDAAVPVSEIISSVRADIGFLYFAPAGLDLGTLRLVVRAPGAVFPHIIELAANMRPVPDSVGSTVSNLPDGFIAYWTAFSDTAPYCLGDAELNWTAQIEITEDDLSWSGDIDWIERPTSAEQRGYRHVVGEGNRMVLAPDESLPAPAAGDAFKPVVANGDEDGYLIDQNHVLVPRPAPSQTGRHLEANSAGGFNLVELAANQADFQTFAALHIQPTTRATALSEFVDDVDVPGLRSVGPDDYVVMEYSGMRAYTDHVGGVYYPGSQKTAGQTIVRVQDLADDSGNLFLLGESVSAARYATEAGGDLTDASRRMQILVQQHASHVNLFGYLPTSATPSGAVQIAAPADADIQLTYVRARNAQGRQRLSTLYENARLTIPPWSGHIGRALVPLDNQRLGYAEVSTEGSHSTRLSRSGTAREAVATHDPVTVTGSSGGITPSRALATALLTHAGVNGIAVAAAATGETVEYQMYGPLETAVEGVTPSTGAPVYFNQTARRSGVTDNSGTNPLTHWTTVAASSSDGRIYGVILAGGTGHAHPVLFNFLGISAPISTTGLPSATPADEGDLPQVQADGTYALAPSTALAGGITEVLWAQIDLHRTAGGGASDYASTDGWTIFDAGNEAGVRQDTGERNINLRILTSPPPHTFFLAIKSINADDEVEDIRVIPYGERFTFAGPVTVESAGRGNTPLDPLVNIGLAITEHPTLGFDTAVAAWREGTNGSTARLQLYGLASIGGTIAEGVLDERVRVQLNRHISAAAVDRIPTAAPPALTGWGTDDNQDIGWQRILRAAHIRLIEEYLTQDATEADFLFGRDEHGIAGFHSRAGQTGGFVKQIWASSAVPAGQHIVDNGIEGARWTATPDGGAINISGGSGSTIKLLIMPANPPSGVSGIIVDAYVRDDDDSTVEHHTDTVAIPWGGFYGGGGNNSRGWLLRLPDGGVGTLRQIRLSWNGNDFRLWGNGDTTPQHARVEVGALVSYTGTATQDQIDSRISASGVIRSDAIARIRSITRAQYDALTNKDVSTLYLFTG